VGKILERRSGSLPVVISNFRENRVRCGSGTRVLQFGPTGLGTGQQ